MRGIPLVLALLLSIPLLFAGCDRKDNDWADFSATLKSVDAEPTLVAVAEGGATGQYRLSLSLSPLSEVRVAIAADLGEVTVSPDTVVFGTDDWADDRLVEVTAVDDRRVEAAHADSLRHVVITDDAGYRDAAVPVVAVNVADNDLAAVDVAPTALQLAESDGDDTETYEVSLSSEPGAAVRVVAASIDATVRIDPDTVVFHPLLWDEPATVTVWVEDDDVAEGQHGAEITHVVLSDDDAFDGVAAASVQLTIDDDGQPVLDLETPAPAIEASGASITLRLELTSPSAFDVTARLTTADVTATAGVDYVAVDEQITIPSGETFVLRDVTVLDDATPEGAESFTATLSDVQGAQLGDAEAACTILDDDLPALSVNDVVVAEGDGEAVFRVSITPVSARDVVFTFATADNTAVAPTDYSAVAMTDTIPAGEAWVDVPVVIVDNAVSEPVETFTVHLLAAPDQASILDGEGVGTIVDDDGDLTVFVVDTTAQEDDGSAVFQLNLSGLSQQDVVLTCSTQDGTATAGDDYTARTDEQVVIESGSLSTTFAVPLIDDGDAEETEAFTLLIVDASGAAIGDPSADCVVTDDDPVTLDVGDAVAGEQEGTIVFRVAKTPAVSRDVAFQIDTVSGTAGEGDDFLGVHTTLAIPADSTGVDVQVGIVQDDLHEPDETFTVQLSAPTGLAVIGDGVGAGTIQDDDGLSVSVGDVLVDEDGGPAVFTLTLSGQSQQDLTLLISTQDGTAAAGADYQAQSDVAVVVDAGLVSAEHEVVIIDDEDTEDSETFSLVIVDGGGATIADGEGECTIVDDESVTISVTGVTVSEGDGTAVFTVTESPPVSRSVTFDFATSSGTAIENVDFTGVDQSYTIVPGHSSVDIPVAITDDLVFEAEESFTVEITATPDQANVGQGTAEGVIEDDDPVTVTFENESVDEDGGDVVFTFVLSGQAEPDIELTVSTADGSATAGQDYVAQTAATVTVAGGQTSAALPITVLDDGTAEDDETFTLHLEAANFAGVVFGNDTALCTIADDGDPVRLSVSGDASAAEDDGSIVVTVLELDPVSRDVNFRFSTVDGTASAGADFTGATNQLELIPAAADQVAVNVNLLDDGIHEHQESFSFVITGVPGQSVVVDDTAALTIDDDDALTVSGAGATADEDAGQLDFVFTLNRPSAVDQVMTYALADLSAEAGEDYTVPGDPTFTIPAGSTEGTASIPLLDDGVPEAVESFRLTLTDAADAAVSGPDAFDGVIDDDDPVVLDVGDAQAVEGEGQILFRVTKTPPIARAASFDFDTATGDAIEGADFQGVHETVILPADSAGVFVTVPVVTDELDEPDESFGVAISAPSPLAVLGDDSGLGLIIDDDESLVTVGVSDETVSEDDGTAVFTLALSGTSGQDVVLTLSTQDGTAQAPGDYTSRIDESATIIAGQLSTTFEVTLADDGTPEPEEAFTLEITDAQGADIDDAVGQCLVADDDPLQLVITTVTATESTSDTDLLRVAKSPDIARTVEFTTAFADGTAQAGVDYVDTGDTHTIASGSPSFDVPLTVLDDATHDPDQDFTATITASDPVAATSPAPYDVTILDDDLLAVAVADTSVVEHDGFAVIRIDLGRLSEDDVTLNLSTVNGTAEPGEDYTPWSGRLVTFTAPVAQDTVRIDVSHDFGAGDEIFYLRINDAQGHAIVDNMATITILDDD